MSSSTVDNFKTSICRKSNFSSVSFSKRLWRTDTSLDKESSKTFDTLSKLQRQQLLDNLKLEYALIVFDCSSSQDSIENKIECFARKAFSVSLPMDKIIEIHIDLIDNLECQLMLEGLSTDYMSDFHLTLINVLAHLGELYRNTRYQKI